MAYRISITNFKKAVKGTGGIYSTIADKLGVCRQTVSKYLKDNLKARQLLESEQERITDSAEGVLFKKIVKEEDMNAVKYYLSTKGKKRGYVEKTEVSNEVSGTVKLEWVGEEESENS